MTLASVPPAVGLSIACAAIIVVILNRLDKASSDEPQILKSQAVVGVWRQLRNSFIAGLMSLSETSKWTLEGYQKVFSTHPISRCPCLGVYGANSADKVQQEK